MFDINALLDGAIAVIPTVSMAALLTRHTLNYRRSKAPHPTETTTAPPTTTPVPPIPPQRPVRLEWVATVMAVAMVAAVAAPEGAIAALPPANPPLPVLTLESRTVEAVPKSPNFQGMSMRDLRKWCKDNGVKGYSPHAKSKGKLVKFLLSQQ